MNDNGNWLTIDCATQPAVCCLVALATRRKHALDSEATEIECQECGRHWARRGDKIVPLGGA